MAADTVIDLVSSPRESAASQQPPSSHRLPTVSASAALRSLQDPASAYISTGLNQLDALLAGHSSTQTGGLERGKVTEVWGPAGAGKTALTLQTAVNAIDAGDAVLWVDASKALSSERLRSVLSRNGSSPNDSRDRLSKIRHKVVPTLSHLLALILQPQSSHFTLDCGVLVIEGLGTVVNLDYPRVQTATITKPEQQRWLSGRRYAMLGSIVTALNKIAVLHNMAVIVTTSCSTRMRSERGLGAALVPGIGGAEWDAGVWNRLAVFRDFGARFIGVQKAQGKHLISREEVGEPGKLACFDISPEGKLQERRADVPPDGGLAPEMQQRVEPVRPPKRSFDEIADSEDEDVDEYGWADADEHAMMNEGLAGETQQAESAANPG